MLSAPKQLIAGPTGQLEIAYEAPQGACRALAVICHPHPLHGGTMDNKVVTTLGRACAMMGCAVVRFNYRGVGASAGQFDNTVGEADDAAAALAWLQAQHSPALPVVLAGFSFGTAVAARLAARLAPDTLSAMILAGAAVQRFAQVDVPVAKTLMIHGELDETVPLQETIDWAVQFQLPVTVVPRSDHFFNKQLGPLKSLALRHLQALL